MMRENLVETLRERFWEGTLRFLSPFLVLILWEMLVRLEILDHRFFPPPTKVLQTLFQLFQTGEMITHTTASLQRLLFGFLIGASAGLLLGLAIGWSRIIEKLIDPLIALLYPIPKLALLPLILIIFGLGEESKIAIVSIGVFFTVVINTAASVKGIEPVYIDAARNFGAKGIRMFWQVVIPAALPGIFTGLRLGLGFGLIVIVAAEFVASKEGLGFLVWLSWGTLSTTKMYAGLVMIGIVGLTTTYFLQWLSVTLMPWNLDREHARSHKGQPSPGIRAIVLQKIRHFPSSWMSISKQYLYEVPNSLPLMLPDTPPHELHFNWITPQNVSAIQSWKGKPGVTQFRQKLNRGMVGLFTLCEDRVVGYIWAVIYTKQSASLSCHYPIQPGDGFVESAEVHRDFLRRGIASHQRYFLISQIRETSLGNHIRRVCGISRIENTPILKLVEKQGGLRKQEFIQLCLTPWIYFRWFWDLDEHGRKIIKSGRLNVRFKIPEIFYTPMLHKLIGKEGGPIKWGMKQGEP